MIMNGLLKGTFFFKMTAINMIIILICWDAFIKKCPFVCSECDGIYSFKPCCVGEKWDESLQRCAKCPRGWYGENCSLECDIPYYGYRCSTGKCSCNRISCNISSACSNVKDKKIKETKPSEMSITRTKTTTAKTTRKSTTMTNATEELENTAELTTLEGTTSLSKTEKNIISNKLIPSFAISFLVLVFGLLCCYIRAKIFYSCKSKVEVAENRLEYGNNYMDTTEMPVYENLNDIRIYDIPHHNDCDSSGGSWKSSLPPHEGDYDDIANVMHMQGEDNKQ